MTMKIIAPLILVFYVNFTFGQNVDTIGFEIAAFSKESKQQGYSPFILRLTNTSNKELKIPKYYIAGNVDYEEVNVVADIYYNGQYQSEFMCDICLFDPKLRKEIVLSPKERLLIQPSIACTTFTPGAYRIRFRLIENRTNLYGVT